MGLYASFQTNPEYERDGIWLDYGSFRIRLRFAGGSNKQYNSLMEVMTKPYRRAIEQGVFPEDRMRDILRTVYAKTMVADWETEVSGEMKKGIEGPNGELLPVTEANLIMTFENLPNIFLDLVQQASVIGNYRMADLEADSGNSKKS